MDAKDVLNFWFEELSPSQWFKVSPELDETISHKFADLLSAASRGELYSWRTNAMGRLAQEMVLFELDEMIPISMRAFVYMPYMHSESRKIHNEAIRLFSGEGMEENLLFEIDHKKIIDQFGRYPHRNGVLHRLSTSGELDFVKTHKAF